MHFTRLVFFIIVSIILVNDFDYDDFDDNDNDEYVYVQGDVDVQGVVDIDEVDVQCDGGREGAA